MRSFIRVFFFFSFLFFEVVFKDVEDFVYYFKEFLGFFENVFFGFFDLCQVVVNCVVDFEDCFECFGCVEVVVYCIVEFFFVVFYGFVGFKFFFVLFEGYFCFFYCYVDVFEGVVEFFKVVFGVFEVFFGVVEW